MKGRKGGKKVGLEVKIALFLSRNGIKSRVFPNRREIISHSCNLFIHNTFVSHNKYYVNFSFCLFLFEIWTVILRILHSGTRIVKNSRSWSKPFLAQYLRIRFAIESVTMSALRAVGFVQLFFLSS